MENRINKGFWHKHGHTIIIYVFLTAFMVFASIFNKDFSILGNFKNLLRSSFPLLMAVLGQTLIILTGGTDLSLGGIMTLCNVVCVLSVNPDFTWGFVPALGAVAAMGLACGTTNGVLVTKERLTPITVTVATTVVFGGMALLLMPNLGGNIHKALVKFLTRRCSDTAPFLLFILILCLVRRLANNTPHGKVLRAIGGSENAAYSADIRMGRIEFRAYCPAGLLCAVVGIFLNAQTNSANMTIGKNYAMNTITTTVVGGAAMTGAVGDPLGAIAGMFIVSIIDNMLNLSGISSFYQFIYQGLILIAALSLSALYKRCQGLRGLII